MKKALFISPHFDDETLAAGATIHKLKDKVEFIVAGVTLSERMFEKSEKALEQAKEAMKILGVKTLISPRRLGHFEDMYVDSKGALMVELIKLVREFSPDIVLTTHYNDFHTDHRAVATCSKEVAYQASRSGVLTSTKASSEPLLLFGEVDLEGITNIRADVFCEVSEDDLNAKWEALKCYKELVGTHPAPFSEQHGKDWIWGFARLRGMQCGVKYAEIFEIGNIHPKINMERFL